jgi:hypothetical protein
MERKNKKGPSKKEEILDEKKIPLLLFSVILLQDRQIKKQRKLLRLAKIFCFLVALFLLGVLNVLFMGL